MREKFFLFHLLPLSLYTNTLSMVDFNLHYARFYHANQSCRNKIRFNQSMVFLSEKNIVQISTYDVYHYLKDE